MHEAEVNSVPLNPAQAAALAELVELESTLGESPASADPEGGLAAPRDACQEPGGP
jgi:hypothetical protein